jgi:hypothetical protein
LIQIVIGCGKPKDVDEPHKPDLFNEEGSVIYWLNAGLGKEVLLQRNSDGCK